MGAVPPPVPPSPNQPREKQTLRVSVEFSLSAIIAIVLIVLDKADKLTPPVLVVLLTLAGLLALHPSWRILRVGEESSRVAKTWRAFVACAAVLILFGLLGLWIWPKSPKTDQAKAGHPMPQSQAPPAAGASAPPQSAAQTQPQPRKKRAAPKNLGTPSIAPPTTPVVSGSADVQAKLLALATPVESCPAGMLRFSIGDNNTFVGGLCAIEITSPMCLTMGNHNYVYAINDQSKAICEYHKPKPPMQQQCAPGSICNQGSEVDAQQSVYNLGPPSAEITNLAEQRVPAIPQFVEVPNDPSRETRVSQYHMALGMEYGARGPTWNPGLRVSFTVSQPLPNPNFSFNCDAPCVVTSIGTTRSGGGRTMSEGGLPDVLVPGLEVFSTLRSIDPENPVTYAQVLIVKKSQ